MVGCLIWTYIYSDELIVSSRAVTYEVFGWLRLSETGTLSRWMPVTPVTVSISGILPEATKYFPF